MNTINEQSENQAIIDLATQRAKVELHVIDGVTVAARPAGVALESIKKFCDEYLTKPERLKGKAKLETLASFIAHIKRFKDAGSALFAHVGDKPWLFAVYDYNQGPGAPRFGGHVAEYMFPISREWAVWMAIDGKSMEQGAFAAWIEDHAADVVVPTLPEVAAAVEALRAVEITPGTPTQILTFSRGIDVRVESNVVNRVSLPTGGQKLVFDESIKGAAGEPLDVPGGFIIAIPIFDGGGHYALPVRLRLRVEKGRVLWSIAILRAADVLRDAVTAAAEKARTDADVPLFYGTPESNG
jgi:uncharacterized protein YfdQ (DUF2303 family)